MITLSQKATRSFQDAQLIMVSNRGPVGWAAGDPASGEAGRVVHQEGGGLIVAMDAMSAATDAIWVAVAKDDSADRELATRARLGPLTDDSGNRYRMAYITPSEKEYSGYYNTIANPLLWFMQHYLWDVATQPVVDGRIRDAWDDGYVRVNRMFADEVERQARRSTKTPLVMLQDYHLYLAPEMIRRKLPNAVIQQFVHIPWPEPGYWQILPGDIRRQILTGMLGNDIIGFQTARDAQAFINTVASDLHLPVTKHGVKFQGRTVSVRDYPISVDTDSLERISVHPKTLLERAEIRSWRPEKLIVRVDRMDLSKNIVRGFLAYAEMLEKHPEARGQVQYFAFLQHTRSDLAEYSDYADRIDRVVDDVNRRFGTDAWTPIVLEKGQSMNRAVAAYQEFDLLVVNPVRDGMNLVVKDGMFCNQRNGAVVLSYGAGAIDELGEWVLPVDAVDIGQTAEAMWQGLTMSERQKQVRSDAIKDQIRRHPLGLWLERQAVDIGRFLGLMQKGVNPRGTPGPSPSATEIS